MLEQPAVRCVSWSIQGFVAGDLGVAARTSWGGCAGPQAPSAPPGGPEVCWGGTGNGALPAAHHRLVPIPYATRVSEAIRNQLGCPLVPVQGGRAGAEAAVHYADAPGCPQERRMLNRLSPPATRGFGEPGWGRGGLALAPSPNSAGTRTAVTS